MTLKVEGGGYAAGGSGVQARERSGLLAQTRCSAHSPLVLRRQAGIYRDVERELYRELVARLQAICGSEHVLLHEHQLYTYGSDGLLHYSVVPPVAVLPGTGEEVQRVVRACHELRVP